MGEMTLYCQAKKHQVTARFTYIFCVRRRPENEMFNSQSIKDYSPNIDCSLYHNYLLSTWSNKRMIPT